MYYSKILLYIFITFFVSIWFGDYFQLPFSYTLIAFFLLILIFFVPIKVKFLFFMLSLLIIGNVRYHLYLNEFNHSVLDELNQRKSLQGVVVSENIFKNSMYQFKVRLFDNNTLQVQSEYAYKIKYGDFISFSCNLRKPEIFDGFDYPKYLAKNGILARCKTYDIERLDTKRGNTIYSFILEVKAYFISSINTALPDPYSSFLAGLLVGGTQGLPSDIVMQFKRTGTSHIVAVSGFNVAIIVNFIFGIFRVLSISRKKSFWGITIGLILFNLITGFQASIVRAVVMGWIIVLGRTLGRYVNIRNVLIYAAFILVMINPLILRYDIGFQLSFIATIALIYFTPVLSRALKTSNLGGIWLRLSVNDFILPTLSAYIWTLPLILYYFGSLSIIAPIVNALIAPLVPIAMFAGFVTGVWHVALPVANVVAFFSWVVLAGILKIINFFASFDWSYVSVNGVSYAHIIFMYIFLFIIMKEPWLYFQKNKKQK